MKIAFLREALRLDPSLQPARIAIWSVYTELGEHQTALTAVRQVPASHDLAREASFLASVSLVHLGRHQDAFDSLTESESRRSGGIAVQQSRGRAAAAAA